MKTPCSSRVATQDEFCSTSVALSGKGSVFTTLLQVQYQESQHGARSPADCSMCMLIDARICTHIHTVAQISLVSLNQKMFLLTLSLSLDAFEFSLFLTGRFLSFLPCVVIRHSCWANSNAASPFNFHNIRGHYLLTACLFDRQKCDPAHPKSSIQNKGKIMKKPAWSWSEPLRAGLCEYQRGALGATKCPRLNNLWVVSFCLTQGLTLLPWHLIVIASSVL